MSKFKHWGVNVGLTLGSFAVGVLIGEVGLRVAGIEGIPKIPDVVESAPTQFHISDPDRGWQLRPGASGEWRQEGESYVQVNSDGLRDREHTKAKPKNVYRIAVLGDSFTEAIHVPIEQTFWSKLEGELGKCSALKGKQVETINFGVQGYGTAQQLISLQKKAWPYSPDLVILAFFSGNDVMNNSPHLEYDQYRPFFVEKNGRLSVDMSFRNLTPLERNPYAVSLVDKLPTWLVNNSRILQVAKKSELEQKKSQLSERFTALRGKLFVEQEQKDPIWQEAWQLTEKGVRFIRDEVRQKGSDFLLVHIPDPIVVNPNGAAQKRFQEKYGAQDFSYPDRRLQQFSNRQGISLVNLTEPFQSYARQNNRCLHGFPNAAPCGGHWNAEGHQLAGTIIAQKLCGDLSKLQESAKVGR